jgi:hypothetical protein
MSATHLVEACRSYNAIFAPLDNQATGYTPYASGPDETVDASDSSTNLSTDWGDLIR